MKFIFKRTVLRYIFAIGLSFNISYADATYDTMKLINIVGNQMMLSQQIAKDYLYIGKNVSKVKASKELTSGFLEIKKAHSTLSKSINDSDIKNLLEFVEMSTEDLEDTAQNSFNIDNAQLIIDLSESILEGSEYVINSLKDSINVNESKMVELSARQRMLAQRIAKYYIAYQSGIKDKNTVVQMNEAVSMFASTHETLLQNKLNTPKINQKLNKIDRLWKIVYKFYLKIEKGGLPLIVFKTTGDITKLMTETTKLYVELYK